MNLDFLKQFNISNAQFIKACIFVALAFTLLFVISAFQNGGHMGMSRFGTEDRYDESASTESIPMGMPMYQGDGGYDTRLSTQNVTRPEMPPTYGGYTGGNTAEAFEVKNYSAGIETRNLAEDCTAIQTLKARTDVIFENANMYDRGCSFTFKVEKESVEEILSIIKTLNPKELSENTYTIKREVDDYTTEIQIYQNKLASLDATLADALASYQNITELATRTGDVESLAKIIDSKLMLIERLTGARIDTQNQLDYIQRSKADALDRLTYTYFSVNVYMGEYVDEEALGDSWKIAIQQFVQNVNQFAQEMSIGFVMLLLSLLKLALYGIILLIAVKFGWKFVRSTWQS